MRCPKCGYISFDYLKSCEKCGRDLAETAKNLGPFLMEDLGFSWFASQQAGGDAADAAEPPVQPVEPETREQAPGSAPVDLAEIDMSDLVADTSGDSIPEELEDIEELDVGAIETIVDDDFKKALEDLITE